jgi:Recombination endonuclease VII
MPSTSPHFFEGEIMTIEEKRARKREYMRVWRLQHPGYQAAADKQYYYAHLDACREKGRQRYHRASPEAKLQRKRNRAVAHLRRTYNLTPSDKQGFYDKQKGLCYLCGESLGSCDKAVVEHSHLTGELRGLAHRWCNVHLGQIEKLWQTAPSTLLKMLAVAGVNPCQS